MCGWLTQLLMVLLASSVSKTFNPTHFKKYNFILVVNLLASYGMAVSFLFQGYGAVSIFFSTLSIVVVYYFGIQLWRDMNRAPTKLASFIWFKASIIFAILSSIGVAMLVYLMITKNVNVNVQQATTYFYLHFQYNGWFIFGILGLLINLLSTKGIKIKNINTLFWLYAGSCIPAYFLSVLWVKMPLIPYIIVAIAAIIIFGGWIWLALQIRKQFRSFIHQIPKMGKVLLYLSALAYTIKVFLQVGSVIPSLNTLAFGYRPIVIGYLHLVFLGVVSLFLLGYLIYTGYVKVTKMLSVGIIIFVTGIILNELILMMQGLMAMGYYHVSQINEILLGVTGIMLIGAFIISISAHTKISADHVKEI